MKDTDQATTYQLYDLVFAIFKRARQLTTAKQTAPKHLERIALFSDDKTFLVQSHFFIPKYFTDCLKQAGSLLGPGGSTLNHIGLG